MKGKIIFLNGTSSAGKTTLAKALQEKLQEPYYFLSFDSIRGMIPDKYRRGDFGVDVAWKLFFNAASWFNHSIKLFSDMGFNTVVEYTFEKSHKTLEECVELLHEYPVLFVHVTCPAEELRRREKERGDRQPGLAENLLKNLEPQDTYDITADTHNNSTEECADKIIETLNYPEKLTAFKSLWPQRAK